MADRILELEEKKKEIELQISALFEELNGKHQSGLHDPLVDAEGFPRSDVDVYAVRLARHKIACLQNDHKAFSKQIEDALIELHASTRIAIPREERHQQLVNSGAKGGDSNEQHSKQA